MAATVAAFSTEEFMALGLETGGHPKWRDYKHERNIDRFKEDYGVTPQTCHDIWEDLRNFDAEIECLDEHKSPVRLEKGAKPLHLLLGIRFLFKYQEQRDLCRFFGMRSPKTMSKWATLYVFKIERLLDMKMGTLAENDAGFVFFLSVDGTHCAIQEPRPLSSEWSSYKIGGKAGVNYELGILIHKPKLVWVYGPTRPGKYNDLDVFRQKLKGALAALPNTRRVIADGIYSSEPDYVSVKNDLDPPEIRLFKNRVASRHENFNGLLKCFLCLKNKFRHECQFHGICFRSVCAIAQYQLDNGSYTLLDPYP